MAGVAAGAVVSAARDKSQQELINATAQTAWTRRDIDSLILLIARFLRASNWYSLGSEPLTDRADVFGGCRRRLFAGDCRNAAVLAVPYTIQGFVRWAKCSYVICQGRSRTIFPRRSNGSCWR